MPTTPTTPPSARPTPSARAETGPVWARATAAFCKESFDVRSREDFVDALEAFADLSPGEQAFHQAHLTFRQVQGLEDVHRLLARLDRKLDGLDAGSLASLKHLPAIRKALASIAKGQEDMIDIMETGPGTGVAGEEEDDDGDGAPDDDEDSELADAVDADEVIEEEDHGTGEGDALIPEVLPAGFRRPATGPTAEDVLYAERDRGGS